MFVFVLKGFLTCSAYCCMACTTASFAIRETSTNLSTCMALGATTVLGVPTTSSWQPKFRVVAGVEVGLGDTESCQSKSNRLGKFCKVLS